MNDFRFPTFEEHAREQREHDELEPQDGHRHRGSQRLDALDPLGSGAALLEPFGRDAVGDAGEGEHDEGVDGTGDIGADATPRGGNFLGKEGRTEVEGAREASEAGWPGS